MNHCYLIGFVLAFLLVGTGCDSGTAPSLYDPDRSSLSDPTIDTVSPEGSALAGVDVVTINGSNFSTQPSDNLVYFGTDRGNVMEATSTQLRVLAPNNPLPELQLRMSVVGAENFSNSISYGLDPPFIEFGDVKDFESIFGIATDDTGNVFASIVEFGLPLGIFQITPEGERVEFVSSSFPWADLEFGSDNALYGVRNVRALFRVPSSGNNFEVFAVIPNATTQLVTIAIDSNNRIWAAGNNTEIYRIDSDKTIKSYSFDCDVRDLTLYRDFLYVAGTQGETTGIWRFPIDSNGDLGQAEIIIDLTSTGTIPHALAFSVDGHIYVGSDNVDPVLLISPNGDATALYPSILNQQVRKFAWGPEGYLYAAIPSIDASPSGVVRITTRKVGYRKFALLQK
ncbi:MAG: IPT/TIG domain-containing protein [Bacteroidetes bacterium]|nr:IPT/TIG domain-containing protein [Bacteroidota bacterium]